MFTAFDEVEWWETKICYHLGDVKRFEWSPSLSWASNMCLFSKRSHIYDQMISLIGILLWSQVSIQRIMRCDLHIPWPQHSIYRRHGPIQSPWLSPELYRFLVECPRAGVCSQSWLPQNRTTLGVTTHYPLGSESYGTHRLCVSVSMTFRALGSSISAFSKSRSIDLSSIVNIMLVALRSGLFR